MRLAKAHWRELLAVVVGAVGFRFYPDEYLWTLTIVSLGLCVSASWLLYRQRRIMNHLYSVIEDQGRSIDYAGEAIDESLKYIQNLEQRLALAEAELKKQNIRMLYPKKPAVS